MEVLQVRPYGHNVDYIPVTDTDAKVIHEGDIVETVRDTQWHSKGTRLKVIGASYGSVDVYVAIVSTDGSTTSIYSNDLRVIKDRDAKKDFEILELLTELETVETTLARLGKKRNEISYRLRKLGAWRES